VQLGIKVERLEKFDIVSPIGVANLRENLWSRYRWYANLWVGNFVRTREKNWIRASAMRNSGDSRTDAPPGSTGLAARRQCKEINSIWLREG